MNEAKQLSLICQLPKAESLRELCDLTYRITGHLVFISDMAHTILAYTGCVSVPDDSWQTNVINAELDKNSLAQDRAVSIVHQNSTMKNEPILVEDGHVPFPSLIKTLISHGSPVGLMVVTAYLQPFGQEDSDLINLIASFALALLEKERYFTSGNVKSAENFFIQLLDGKRMSHDRVEKRLQVLDFPRRKHMYLLTVAVQNQTTTPGTVSQLIDRFLRLDCCHCFAYNATLVCIYGADEDIVHWETQAPRLHRLLQEEGLSAGISREISAFENLQEYYCQGRDALEIGMGLGREATFCFPYDHLSSFLLFRHLPQGELLRFCHQKIQQLAEYDSAHNTELCTTLQVYLEQAKSLSKSADVLYIHRNTVHYRVNKCMELLHSSLEDGNEIFSYILSLRILEYRKKILKDIRLQ